MAYHEVVVVDPILKGVGQSLRRVFSAPKEKEDQFDELLKRIDRR